MRDEKKCKAMAERIFLNDLSECEYFPKYIEINTVDGCNSRCVMCLRSSEPKDKKSYLMTDELFDKFVDEVKEYTDWIEMILVTCLGEPLLDPKLPERIKKLKDIGIKHIHISTNAALLTEEWVYKLYESKVDDIRISLDGLSKEVYEAVRVGLNYDIVKKNVLNFLRIREELKWDVEVRIRMVGLDINKNEQEAWMEYWRSQVRSTDRVQIIPAEPMGKFHEKERAEFEEAMKDVLCVSVFSTVVIKADGSVQFCCMNTEDKYVIGNLAETKIADIWRSPKMKKVRELHMEGKRNEISVCRGCITWNNEYIEDEHV